MTAGAHRLYFLEFLFKEVRGAPVGQGGDVLDLVTSGVVEVHLPRIERSPAVHARVRLHAGDSCFQRPSSFVVAALVPLADLLVFPTPLSRRSDRAFTAPGVESSTGLSAGELGKRFLDLTLGASSHSSSMTTDRMILNPRVCENPYDPSEIRTRVSALRGQCPNC